MSNVRRLYSTARWQKLRAYVLARDGYVCQVQGPRCEGYATTAHHRLPSSQYPQHFFDLANVQASCAPCNRHGAQVQAENRSHRMVIAELEQTVEDLQLQLSAMAAELKRWESGELERAEPAIY
jgi:5-methylcytosine-specific restriction endonuclease McrA